MSCYIRENLKKTSNLVGTNNIIRVDYKPNKAILVCKNMNKNNTREVSSFWKLIKTAFHNFLGLNRVAHNRSNMNLFPVRISSLKDRP